MKMNFFKRLTEKIRQPFLKEELKKPVEVAIEQPVEVSLAVDGQSVEEIPKTETMPIASEVVSSDRYIRQVRCFICKDGEPIGKPFGRHPEIRIVYVNNFVDAFQLFLRLSDQRLLECHKIGLHLFYEVIFPDGNGKLTFTDKVTCRNRATVAILKIEICGFSPQINEIRFEVNH